MLIKLPVWNEGATTFQINDDSNVPNGILADPTVVLEWGVTDTDNMNLSEILQRAPLRTVSNFICNKKYSGLFGLKTVITDSMLCAYSKDGKDACRGDSGGPLIKEHPIDPSIDLAVGVVSWGEECGHEEYPGVYSRISKSYDWITDSVCNVL